MGASQLLAVVAILGVIAFSLRTLRKNPTLAAPARRRLRRPSTWLVGVPMTVLLLGVGLPFAYTQWMNRSALKPLTFADLPAAPTTVPAGPTTTADGRASTAFADAPAGGIAPGGASAAASAATKAPTAARAAPLAADSSIAGSWIVGTGSQGGYSIDDTAMGQTSRVVGRTSKVSGTMAATGTSVTAARVVVDMQSVTCRCIHDAKYRMMMETSKYPTSTFELTQPIALATIPPPDTVISVPVTGNFTIHGVTHAVSFTLKATRTGARIAVNGSLPVRLEDYGVSTPNAGSMGGLSNCQIDLLIAFDRTT
jgi:polyisoprenoid-binding protein YceI